MGAGLFAFLFFLQAEDGMRAPLVTGVQTCALPISRDEHCKSAHVRAMADDAKGYGDDLWGEMGKLGWLGLPFPEEYRGAGLGLVELAIVLEEMGRAAYPGPFFSTVVLGGLGLMLGGSAEQ